MTKAKSDLDGVIVEESCRLLRLPTIAAQFERLARYAAGEDCQKFDNKGKREIERPPVSS